MSRAAARGPRAPRPGRVAGRLDPHAPLVIDTRELGRRAGSMRTLSRTVPSGEGLAVAVARVPPGSPLRLDVRLESVVEGVLVTGMMTGPLAGECVRCLEPVTDMLTVSFQELFAYPEHARRFQPGAASAVQGEEEDVGEISYLDGDLLDLEPVVRDAVVLSLPLTPLCSPDCAGLCAQCGVRLADHPGHRHDQLDPRWAELSTLARQHEEE